MSINDRNAAELYQAMHDFDRPRPPSLLSAARAADKAWEAMADEARQAGLIAPNDDRAENIVHAIFRGLAEANGLDVDMLADVVRATDTN